LALNGLTQAEGRRGGGIGVDVRGEHFKDRAVAPVQGGVGDTFPAGVARLGVSMGSQERRHVFSLGLVKDGEMERGMPVVIESVHRGTRPQQDGQEGMAFQAHGPMERGLPVGIGGGQRFAPFQGCRQANGIGLYQGIEKARGCMHAHGVS
jgi:hypothetical protein